MKRLHVATIPLLFAVPLYGKTPDIDASVQEYLRVCSNSISAEGNPLGSNGPLCVAYTIGLFDGLRWANGRTLSNNLDCVDCDPELFDHIAQGFSYSELAPALLRYIRSHPYTLHNPTGMAALDAPYRSFPIAPSAPKPIAHRVSKELTT